MDNRVKKISENFALSLTYNLEILELHLDLIQSHNPLHTGIFVQSEQD